jgi:phytoene/squalene synthetase
MTPRELKDAWWQKLWSQVDHRKVITAVLVALVSVIARITGLIPWP